MSDTVPPTFNGDAFTCPHCGAFAHQYWFSIVGHHSSFGNMALGTVSVARCSRCEDMTVWFEERLVHPDSAPAPMPNVDLPDDVKADFIEARSIYSRSPRGSAALLRLCIQKLCVFLGEPGKDLNSDIGALVKKHGLLPQIQQALDAVRVVGNNAVHPGELDLNDTPELAFSLFGLVNAITDQLISHPKQVEELYQQLPEGARKAVENRDRAQP